MDTYKFRAMNTDITMAAEGDADRLAEGFREAQAYVEACEQRFTRFTDTSELADLNRSSGSWFQASQDLFDLVREAWDYREDTGGLFDPAILPALEKAGYDRSMDLIRAYGPGQGKPESVWMVQDLEVVQFDHTAHQIWLPPGMRIDLGGIAKGWIAERAACRLAEYAPACGVDAGGDLFTIGLPAGESAWPVTLEDPRDAEETLAVLRVPPGAVATSAITKRRWEQGGTWKHHLIDPRLGEPAQTDWLSVTIIAPSATTAEVFAKALLIAGSREAGVVASRNPEIDFIAVDANGKLWGSNHSKEYLHV
jgi:thiamine biosynthesis lipoprotein